MTTCSIFQLGKPRILLRFDFIRGIVTLIFFGSFILSKAQEPTKFAPKLIHADIDSLVSLIETVHINPYGNISKNKFYHLVDSLKRSISTPIESLELYKRLAPLIVLLGDGHTNLYPNDEWALPQVIEQNLLFPFVFRIEDSVFVVEKNLTDLNQISTGSKITSVDGIETSVLINSLISYCNGERIAFRISSLADLFFMYHYLFYNQTGKFTVGMRFEDQEEKEFKVEGINYTSLSNAKQTFGAYYSFSILNNNSGLIDFRQMSDPTEFKHFLDSTFNLIEEKGIEHLIIDIRRNPGGNSYLGEMLTEYLTEKSFKPFSRVETKLSRPVRMNLDRYNKFTKDTLLIDLPKSKTPSDKIKQFDGEIYLLIGSYTFSSATDFAAIIKDHDIATVIGQETGGLATSFGDDFNFSLPHTNVSGRIAYRRFVRPNGEDTGRGVIPHYIVKPNPDEIDPELEFVFEMIDNK